jgi:Ni/Co efflux regulator RcnB
MLRIQINKPWNPMKPILLKMKCASALVIGGILAAGPAIADKPDWAGGGKGGKHERSDRRDEQRGERRDEQRGEQRDDDGNSRGDRGRSAGKRGHFEERHTVVVREYYGEQFRSGRCPPGLAKKHNGCMPPGQAKKWHVGRPLPRDVIYYEVPRPLVIQIGQPPSGYRYVRVATDILIIAIGSGMVVDAIQDLGR